MTYQELKEYVMLNLVSAQLDVKDLCKLSCTSRYFNPKSVIETVSEVNQNHTIGSYDAKVIDTLLQQSRIFTWSLTDLTIRIRTAEYWFDALTYQYPNVTKLTIIVDMEPEKGISMVRLDSMVKLESLIIKPAYDEYYGGVVRLCGEVSKSLKSLDINTCCVIFDKHFVVHHLAHVSSLKSIIMKLYTYNTQPFVENWLVMTSYVDTLLKRNTDTLEHIELWNDPVHETFLLENANMYPNLKFLKMDLYDDADLHKLMMIKLPPQCKVFLRWLLWEDLTFDANETLRTIVTSLNKNLVNIEINFMNFDINKTDDITLDVAPLQTCQELTRMTIINRDLIPERVYVFNMKHLTQLTHLTLVGHILHPHRDIPPLSNINFKLFIDLSETYDDEP